VPDRLRLADLVARGSLLVNDGYRTRADELGRPGIPVLRVAEVQQGQLTPTFGDHVLEKYRSKIADKVSRPRDVVVTTKGTVGRVALMSVDDSEFVYSPQVCFFRCLDDAIHPRWLYYWFTDRSSPVRQPACKHRRTWLPTSISPTCGRCT